MSMIKTVLIGLFIGAIMIIISKYKEPFMNSTYFREYNGSDIIVPQIPSVYPNKNNELIIPPSDEYNTFPLIKSEPDVIAPIPIIYDAKEDEAYKDTDFRRGKGIENAFDIVNERIIKSYSGVENAYNIYNIPKDSSNDLEFKKYNEINNKESMYLADIHDMMTAKITKQLSKNEFNNIAGNMIPINEITIQDKSVYMSLDDDNVRELFKVDYKYQPFENIAFGSML